MESVLTRSARFGSVILLKPSLTAVTAACVAFLAVLFYTTMMKSGPKVIIPLKEEIGNAKKRKEQYCFNSREVLRKGYSTHKNRVFGVDTMDGVKVIVPLSLLDELKSNPALSFQASIDNDTLIDYTYLGGVDPTGVTALTTRLNPTLAAYTPVLHSLVRRKLFKEVSVGEDWTPVNVFPHLLRLIGSVSARFLHSSAASNNEDWVDLATDYTETVIKNVHALKPWPPLLRPIANRFLPQHKEILQQWAKGRAIVMSTMTCLKNGKVDEPPSMLHHLSSGKNAGMADNADAQLKAQMTLAAAAIHTTTVSVTQVLYDMAAHPEFIPDLRQEASEVLERCGGTFTKQALSEMKKLDSWMKESQRLASPDLTTFQRMAIAPLTLSDGTYIPKGTKLEVATCSVHADESRFPKAGEFDGLRYYRKRQEPGAEHKHQYISVGSTDLAWGYGRHSCPGRFVADIEIKIALAEILLNYDVKFPDGQQRPKNIEFEATVFPDPEAIVLLKRL